MVEVEHYHTYEVGPFAITFVPSVHSKLVLGMKHPVRPRHHLRASRWAGRVGVRLRPGLRHPHRGGRHVSFYHQGSADLIDDAIRHKGVDFFLAGIAGRGFTARYAERILGALEPRVVVPHHYDDFFRPDRRADEVLVQRQLHRLSRTRSPLYPETSIFARLEVLQTVSWRPHALTPRVSVVTNQG